MVGERRHRTRLAIQSPVVVSLGKCKVGLLFDLSEGGLSIHGVLPGNPGDFSFVAFELPKVNNLIVGRVEVAWTSTEANRTGVRFVQLGVESRKHLGGWLNLVLCQSIARTQPLRPDF
jgi:PilZ domain